jgi:hypothetical protein
MRAEAEGFDVFVTQCLDLAFSELREMVDIPVVFMTQATLAYYSQLAPNFAFLVNGERLHYFFEELAERYKVKERRVPGAYVSFAFTDYANLWNHPQPFIEQFMNAGRELVRRAATSLYPAGLYLSQWLIDQGIRDVDGAIVMDPLAIGIKTAELMVDLERSGIKRICKRILGRSLRRRAQPAGERAWFRKSAEAVEAPRNSEHGMSMKIWHQSFTTLSRVPEYNENLRAHIRKVVSRNIMRQDNGNSR